MGMKFVHTTSTCFAMVLLSHDLPVVYHGYIYICTDWRFCQVHSNTAWL